MDFVGCDIVSLKIVVREVTMTVLLQEEMCIPNVMSILIPFMRRNLNIFIINIGSDYKSPSNVIIKPMVAPLEKSNSSSLRRIINYSR